MTSNLLTISAFVITALSYVALPYRFTGSVSQPVSAINEQ
jgi:hypothetical protein